MDSFGWETIDPSMFTGSAGISFAIYRYRLLLDKDKNKIEFEEERKVMDHFLNSSIDKNLWLATAGTTTL